MALTSIGQQKTPGRPVEITFDGETGLPSDQQELLLIGHAAPGTTGTDSVIVISNVASVEGASTEASAKFGAASELTKMIVAAVRANSGGSTFPAIKVVPLTSTETSIPQAAQNAILRVKAEYVVSPYDMQSQATRDILKSLAQTMSGAQRTSNNQFGTIGVAANMAVSDPSLLFKFDTQFLEGAWFRDTGTGQDLNAYLLAEVAAAQAAILASNGVPFNPVDDLTIPGIPAQKKTSDWITVGAGLESETCLNQGWTPLYTKPNTEVAFVRSVTGRLSADGTGTPVVTSYYDVQDFNVLYFWRKTLYTRFRQPDFTRRKASAGVAALIKSEAIRLARLFEDQGMFQAVGELAKEFQVERNISDRSRFDIRTPVNVIPGLHVIATNVVATTRFDVVTV